MSLESFLRSNRSSQRSGSSQAGPSRAPTITHHAGSRRLAKSASLLSDTSREDSPAVINAQPKEYPEDLRLNSSIVFPIKWDNVWLNSKKLRPDQLSFRVKHLSQLRGNQSGSRVWRHGADLQYVEEDSSRVKLWLCKYCHGQGNQGAARVVNSYHHIVLHLQKEHRIDVSGNSNVELKPNKLRLPQDP